MNQLTDIEQSISKILFDRDPIGVGSALGFPHNHDEYDKEAVDIARRLPGCSNQASAEKLVTEVFEKWFGKDTIDTGTTRQALKDAAKQIYALK